MIYNLKGIFHNTVLHSRITLFQDKQWEDRSSSGTQQKKA